MSPEAAYVLEKPYLKALPPVLPPVYEVIERVADLSGFVSVDTNRYSVPDRLIGKAVSVYKYPGELQILHRGQLIATHARILDRRMPSKFCRSTTGDSSITPAVPGRKSRSCVPRIRCWIATSPS